MFPIGVNAEAMVDVDFFTFCNCDRVTGVAAHIGGLFPMALKKRGRPKGRVKPEKTKTNFGLLPEDVAYIDELFAEKVKIDPYGASKSQVIHEVLVFYRQHRPKAAPDGKPRLASAGAFSPPPAA